MFDAAYPERVLKFGAPKWEVVAGYVGGNTPHVWTDAEWALMVERSGALWCLPIYSRSNPGIHDPSVDAGQLVAWLIDHRVPKGCGAALDLETAIDPGYVRTFDSKLYAVGYKVILYGSKSSLFQNPKPSGGYWVADYTNEPHLYPGSAATQWAGSTPFGGAYDPSLVADSTTLWKVGDPDMPLSAGDLDKIAVIAENSNAKYYRMLARGEMPGGDVDPAHFATSIAGVMQATQNLPRPPTADEIADVILAKLPTGSTTITRDDVKRAVKDALTEGTGAQA